MGFWDKLGTFFMKDLMKKLEWFIGNEAFNQIST